MKIKGPYLHALFFCIFFVFSFKYSSAQSGVSYRPIDSAEWEKAVDGLDYNEEIPQETDSDITMPAPPESVGLPVIIQILLYSAIIALLVFIIMRVIGKDVFKRHKNLKKTQDISEEDIDQTPMETDLEKFLRSAIEKKDFRLAIRIYYLMILQQLHEKSIIIWKKNKTNRDYLLEASDKTFSPQFFNNTIIYEYIWYGEKQLAEEQFTQARQSFVFLLQAITSNPS